MVSEKRADFQNCHIWVWNVVIGQSSRTCTYTLFLSQEVEIELIFSLRAAVSEIPANSQNFPNWAWKWAIDQSSRSHTLYDIYSLSTPWGVEMELIFVLWAAVSEIWADCQNWHIWVWNPMGSRLSLFSLQGEQFPRYGNIFKIAILVWNLVIGQSSRSCTCTLFLSQEVEIELIFSLRVVVSEIRVNYQNCPIFAWNWPKFQMLHIYSLSTSMGRNWDYFAPWAVVSEIWGDFSNCHIWEWNLVIGQSFGFSKNLKSTSDLKLEKKWLPRWLLILSLFLHLGFFKNPLPSFVFPWQ